MFVVIKPKSRYLESLNSKKETVSTTEFAKDYGMSAKAMNIILVELRVLVKNGKTYAFVEPCRIPTYYTYEAYQYSENKFTLSPRWTHEGMEYLYYLLKKEKGLLPLIERK